MFLLSDEAKSIQSRYSLKAVMVNGVLDSLMLSAAGIQSQTTQLKRSICRLEERKTPSRLYVCVFQARIRSWRWACPEALLTRETAMN